MSRRHGTFGKGRNKIETRKYSIPFSAQKSERAWDTICYFYSFFPPRTLTLFLTPLQQREASPCSVKIKMSVVTEGVEREQTRKRIRNSLSLYCWCSHVLTDVEFLWGWGGNSPQLKKILFMAPLTVKVTVMWNKSQSKSETSCSEGSHVLDGCGWAARRARQV